jgi:hypothetical protein
MGKPVIVSNLLSMRIDVVDTSGRPVATLSSQTPEATCVIYIENITQSSRSVKFVNTLPNGTTFMEFASADPNISADSWPGEIANIGGNKTRERRCGVSHKSGTAKQQPIQCDEVYQVQGGPPPPGDLMRKWLPETNNLPFDHKIDIDP